MKPLLIALAVALASPTYAGTPPDRFNHPFAGELIVHKLPPREVQDICMNVRSVGCAHVWNDGSKCVIYVIDRKSRGIWPKDALAHEKRHCDGWKHEE